MGETPFNPYAPPTADMLEPSQVETEALEEGLWRDGARAVALKGKRFPDRCVICNESAKGFLLKRSLIWHHPAIYLLVLLNLLIYVVVALIVRKRGTVHVGVCPRHRRRRRNAILGAWLGVFASIAGMGIGFTIPSRVGGTLVIFSILLLLGSIVVGSLLGRVVHPTRIDQTHIWLELGRPFLESLKRVSL